MLHLVLILLLMLRHISNNWKIGCGWSYGNSWLLTIKERLISTNPVSSDFLRYSQTFDKTCSKAKYLQMSFDTDTFHNCGINNKIRTRCLEINVMIVYYYLINECIKDYVYNYPIATK